MRHLMTAIRAIIVLGLGLGLGALMGWYLAPKPPGPKIAIISVGVVPTETAAGTDLEITTKYQNTGCTQILLARFLMNTKPTPSIALPQLHGPVVLPVQQTEIVEHVPLGFDLYEGEWHLFSVASCYLNGDPTLDATVSPTALFQMPSKRGEPAP